MPNLFEIETRLIEVEAAKAALEELIDARPTPTNEPLTWAAKHLFIAVGDLRQEIDDQVKKGGCKKALTDTSAKGLALIGKPILGWRAWLRSRLAED
jgi:hypothetical protein